MRNMLPIICIPGLICSPRLYAEQVPSLWSVGPVTVAQHGYHDNVEEITRSILSTAPERFALMGLSMGGYVSFEIMRQAPERVVKLALLDTSARPDTPEQTENRRRQIETSATASMDEIADGLFPKLIHRRRGSDEHLRNLLRQMAKETGRAGFVRQQTAIMNRTDSRPTLGEIRCPTMVLVGDGDELTPVEIAAEIADGIAGARLVTVPECGHLSTLEQPKQVTAALMEWLDGG